MAPIRDTTLQDILRALDTEQVPFLVFAKNTPVAVLVRSPEGWKLCQAVLNQERARQAFEEATAQGVGFPAERYWAFHEPGRLLVSAPSTARMRKALEAGGWPPRKRFRFWRPAW